MTSKPYAGIALEPARAAALSKLHASISNAIDDGEQIPCIHDNDRGKWISEVRAEQHAAADRCLDCPLMLQCRAYVTKFPEQTVMGGELPTPPERNRK